MILVQIGLACFQLLYPGNKWQCNTNDIPPGDLYTHAPECDGILFQGGNQTTLLAVACPVESADVLVSWTLPTVNADGTPLEDLAGINVYMDEILMDSLAVVTAYTLQGLTGKHSIQVTAYDTAGNESDVSNPVIVIQ